MFTKLLFKWTSKRLLTGRGHISKTEWAMKTFREICRDEYTEDNLANTYWHLREALDYAFLDYTFLQQEEPSNDTYPKILAPDHQFPR